MDRNPAPAAAAALPQAGWPRALVLRGVLSAWRAGFSRYRTLWRAGGVILLLAALALRGHMLLASVAYVPITADESITVLQAKRISEGEMPLLVIAQPYQFPLEAYLSAPLVKIVPRNTLGARYLSFIEGFLGLLLLLWLVNKTGPLRQCWPVALLVLFPSTYLLTIQFGYSLPHNSPVYLLAWGALLLVFKAPAWRGWDYWFRFFLAGIFCGLAFTNNMLALALVVPILLAAVLQGGWRYLLPNALLLAGGVGVGLVPYYFAVKLYPGAHELVAGTRTIGEALQYLWEPAITVTLTRALGITPTLFPDTRNVLDFLPWLFQVMPFVFAAILLSATVLRAMVIIRSAIQRRQLVLQIFDVFVGVAWLSLMLFALSVRSVSDSYRYLAPAAWSFPFLVGAVYAAASKWLRGIIGGVCVLLAVVNTVTAVKLTEAWHQPDFAEYGVDAPDLRPAIEFLHRQGITHCVASHWQAYRINFLADETIVCSQPLNERFSEWPLPYKHQVDASTNVAYVLSESSSRDFNPTAFEEHLQAMRINAQKSVQGRFSVYYGFCQDRAVLDERRVPPEQLTVTASHNPADTRHLVDKRSSRWTTNRLQEPGMWIQMDLAEPRWLTRMTLVYDDFFRDRAPKINIMAKAAGAWRLVTENLQSELDPFEFENGHPIYRRFLQTIGFKPVLADGLRLEIVEADPDHFWTFMKIDLYARQTAPATVDESVSSQPIQTAPGGSL